MASAIRTRLSIACPASPMRPCRAVLLTPPSPTPAFLQNVANSCICHTSENSPVTPIIATLPKTPSCKPCVCHTYDPLPPPQFHSLLFRSWPHHPANLPLCFQAVAGCFPRNPFRFMLLHGCPAWQGGKPRRHAPVRTRFSFKNPSRVSPPSFPASAFPSIPVLHRDGPAACWDS